MCTHQPPCPAGTDRAGLHAQIVTGHPEQGWYLLCNGVVLFDDGGALLPDQRVLEPELATTR
ncbi:MAG TPA: DUF5999 family protein [Pseudonocardiaceae bacterium]|nr:DUF5999 family protein [Pseudonocardiaceae bacterium]